MSISTRRLQRSKYITTPVVPPSNDVFTGTGGVQAIVTESTVWLSWPVVSGAASYKVYRNGSDISVPVQLADDVRFADGALTPEMAYTYLVRSVASGGAQTDVGTVVPTTRAVTAYPTAATTGVQAGVNLIPMPATGPGWDTDQWGGIFLRNDNMVIENYDVPGTLEIVANNVTVRNCRIVFPGGDGTAISIGANIQNTTIECCTVGGTGVGMDAHGAIIKSKYGSCYGTIVRRCRLSFGATGTMIHEGLVQDCYYDNLCLVNVGSHVNGHSEGGGDHHVSMIVHSTILNPVDQTDAISLFQDFGTQANRIVENNLLAGGGYTIYGGDGPYGPSSYIRIRDNKLSSIYYTDSGSYSTHTAFTSGSPGNEWSGNVLVDGLPGNFVRNVVA